MKTTFAALAANRRRDRRAARPLAVVALRKDGQPSRARVSDLCLARDAEEAAAVLARMESLNPGQRFAVVANPEA